MAHTGMLRASCKSNNIDIDLGVVVDPERPCAVPHSRELLEFADAVLAGEEDRLTKARQRLNELVGDEGVIRAAAVIGNFEMMNRLLDTVGATFGDRLPSNVKAMCRQLAVTPPPHWLS